MRIQVVIADDHDLLLDGLSMMLKSLPDVELVGEASNGEQLLSLTRRVKPDIVLTDVRMPKMDGIQVAKVIKTEFPHIGIIALSSYDEESLIIDMLRAGAKGFLLKTAHKTEILKAIKAVYKDETYYCRNTNLRLAEVVAHKNINPLKDVKSVFTERELQVVRLICSGLTSRKIAEKLNLRPRTIERYRDAIMQKMEVHNSAGVVAYAMKNQLLV